MLSEPAATCAVPPPPTVTRSRSILSALSQPNSSATYCGHCGGPCATMPATILVCARAPSPKQKAAAHANPASSTAPQRERNEKGGTDADMSDLQLRLRRMAAQHWQASKRQAGRPMVAHRRDLRHPGGAAFTRRRRGFEGGPDGGPGSHQPAGTRQFAMIVPKLW